MAIHRVGPAPDTAPHREPLGRVLVTIDDLDALMTMMGSRSTDSTSVRVQFSGGYFTEAKDLRQLSDEELRSLKIHSDNAEVNLSADEAVAVGSAAFTRDVYRLWARQRQSSLGYYRILRGLLFATLTLLGLASVAFMTFVTVEIDIVEASSVVLTVLALAGALGVGIYVAFSRVLKRTGNSVVVIPMSRHEYRQLQTANKYPRAAWIVAIISAVIAAVAIVAQLSSSK